MRIYSIHLVLAWTIMLRGWLELVGSPWRDTVGMGIVEHVREVQECGWVPVVVDMSGWLKRARAGMDGCESHTVCTGGLIYVARIGQSMANEICIPCYYDYVGVCKSM